MATRNVKLLADGRGFTLEATVTADVPVPDGERFRAAIVVGGTIAVLEGTIRIGTARAFAREQGLYLLWPFARSYIDQLALMSGVIAPPLPTLLRPDR